MVAPSNAVFCRRSFLALCRSGSVYRILILAVLCCAIAATSSSVRGQSNVSGRFFGVVRDRATKAVIPDATATFKNLRTGSLTTARSGSDGQFSYTPLPPDDYEIEVKADGYLPQVQRQILTAMQPTPVEPIPFELVRETVAANPTPVPTQTDAANPQPTPMPTAAPRTETETVSLNPSRGAAFDVHAVESLPLGGNTFTRSFDELAFLVPGVNPPPQAIGNTVGPGIGGGVGTSGQFSVNGLRSRANNFTVDGSDNNDEDIGVRRQGFFTLVPQPIESVQEFQIVTLLAPAQYGRNLGAQVNAVSKGGGNAFHGTFYGIGNADFLNARNFFDNAGGNTITPLTAVRLNGAVIPVRLDDQPLLVTNDAGKKDSFSVLQGGFAVGGPIYRNKLFFFGSGEAQHLDGTSERHFAVPSVEQRGVVGSGAQGFFGTCSLSDCPANTVFPIYPTAFVGEAIFSLFPFPNDPNGVYGRNTFTKALPIDATGGILSGKVDWNLFSINGRQQTLTTRYNYTNDKRDLTDVGGALFSAIRPRVRTDNISTYLTGGLTNTLSNEFRFSYGRTRLNFDELRDPFLQPITSLDPSEDTRFLLSARYISNNTIPTCPNGQIVCPSSTLIFSPFVNYETVFNQGAPAVTEDTDLGPVGQVTISGFSPVGVDVFNFPQQRTNGTYQFADTARKIFDAGGSHSLAFGTDIRKTFLDSDLPRNSRPLVTFYGGRCTDIRTFCSQAQAIGYAQPLDFVSGASATGSFQSLVLPGKDARIRLSYYQLDFFAQDEWRPRRNLTLNFGLRYELNTTPKEADRKIENTFSAALPPALSGLAQFIGGRTKIYDSDKNNFAPRLGFAYAPTNHTVVRGGFGVYYDQILGAVVSQSRNVFPTFSTVNFGGGVIADNFINDQPVLTLFNPRDAIFDPSNGFVCSYADFLAGTEIPCAGPGPGGSIFLITPGTLNTINPALSQAQLNAAFADISNLFPGALFSTTLPTRKLDTPLSYQYSIGVEHELFSGTFLSVAYVGTTGRNLLRFTTPNNGTNFVTKISGFFFDQDSCAADQSFCVPLTVGTTNVSPRPIANTGAISQFETTGRSRYNSLQIEFRGRLGGRFQYRTNYVYGRAKDDVSDVFDLAGAFALPQNSLTFAGEYAPANFDVRHRFTYNFIYGTPELRDSNGVVKYLLGGWQIAGTGKFNTGQPFTINTIFDVNQDGNLTDRLDNTQFITVTGDREQPLQLTTTSISDLTKMLAPFTHDGSLPRNSFRAGKVLELDMSFAKKFSFRETQGVEFRADVFNFINRANFGVPVRFLEAPGFGKAVDTITPGRRIQFMVRYLF